MYLSHKFFSIKVPVTVCSSNMTVKVWQLLIRYLGFLMGSQFGKGWEKNCQSGTSTGSITQQQGGKTAVPDTESSQLSWTSQMPRSVCKTTLAFKCYSMGETKHRCRFLGVFSSPRGTSWRAVVMVFTTQLGRQKTAKFGNRSGL